MRRPGASGQFNPLARVRNRREWRARAGAAESDAEETVVVGYAGGGGGDEEESQRRQQEQHRKEDPKEEEKTSKQRGRRGPGDGKPGDEPSFRTVSCGTDEGGRDEEHLSRPRRREGGFDVENV